MGSELNQKLQALLSDPDSLQSILKIAQSFGGMPGSSEPTAASEESKADKADKTEQQASDKDSPEREIPSLGALPALLSAASSSQPKEPSVSDERIRLLLSLRPFLAPPKRQKVDSMIKALSAAQIIARLKDTDIFKSFGL